LKFHHLAYASVLLALFAIVSRPLERPAARQLPAAASTFPSVVQSNEELQNLYLQTSWAKMPTPRTADGHPDLSGFWYNDLGNLGTRDANGNVRFDLGGARNRNKPPRKYPEPSEPSYKPEYAAKVKSIVNGQYGPTTTEDPNFDCLPSGVPRASTGPLQIVQTPKSVVILYESNFVGQSYRVIYTDGRQHAKDLDATYLGHSVGHWEGDTLIVDVAGLNDETWLGGGQGHTEPGLETGEGNHQIVEKFALIHSDKEHVIERYTRRGNMLFYDATVEDPVMFTRPWVLTPRHLIAGGPQDELFETFCVSLDKEHIVKPNPEDSYTCNYCKKPSN
jgi:hypothetical protein